MAWWRRKKRTAKQATEQATGATDTTGRTGKAKAGGSGKATSTGVGARQAPAPDAIPWRLLENGAYARRLGPLAEDPGVGRILDQCARGTLWTAEARRLVAECPQAAEALGRLVAVEDPAGPDSAAFVGGIVSALACLPAEQAVPLLVRLADRRSGLTSGSPAPARAAIRALGGVPGELVPPALHRLASESPLASLRKPAYAELKRRLTTLSDAPEWSADSFGLDARSRIRKAVGSKHTAVVRVNTGGRVSIVYHDASGRALAGKPAAATADPAARADVEDIVALADDLRAAVRAAKTRLESAQRERREIPTADWLAHYLNHPITGQLARTLLWELRTPDRDGWLIGLPRLVERRWSLITVEQDRLVPEEGGLLRIALPRRMPKQEAKNWARFLAKAKTRPVLPQITLR